MAPQQQSAKIRASASKVLKASTGAGVAKRQYKKVRFHENGLLDVERKTGKYLKIARRNQRESPLLRLPPEIRNQIFSYALGGQTFRIWYSRRTQLTTNTTKSKHRLALLAVSRQVHAETALLPFTSNAFASNGVAAFNEWIEELKPTCAATITDVRLQLFMSRTLGIFWCNLTVIDSPTFSFPRTRESYQLSPILRSVQKIDVAFTVSSFDGRPIGPAMAGIEREEKLIQDFLQLFNEAVRFTFTRKLE